MRKTVPIALVLLAVIAAAGCLSAPQTAPYRVVTHPDGRLYAGDQVSFEVIADPGQESSDVQIAVSLGEQELGTSPVVQYGIGRRDQATLWWVWDTRALDPGRYTLTFTQLPDGLAWTESYTLVSARRLPEPEPEAAWASTTTVCCEIFYITGTDAERDLTNLSRMADEIAAEVTTELGAPAGQQRMSIYLMPRVVGHGGFAWGGVYFSYLDDSYIGNRMDILFNHEFVHFYDGAIGGEYLPSILQEGLAVYLSGGHFKPEPLPQRAAALLELDWYIPLTLLADDFYNQQHDIGYLEAGALVQFLVESYGWGTFNEFYRTIPVPAEGSVSTALDAALQESYGLTLTRLEAEFLAYINSLGTEEEIVTDLRLTVELFDTIRRYQAEYDPSAYFLTAWLPDGAQMRQRGIVADLLRRPSGPENRLFEWLLRRAGTGLLDGDYEKAEQTIDLINLLLDGLT